MTQLIPNEPQEPLPTELYNDLEAMDNENEELLANIGLTPEEIAILREAEEYYRRDL